MSPVGSKPPTASGVFYDQGALVASATAGAASGPEHVEVPTRYDAALKALDD